MTDPSLYFNDDDTTSTIKTLVNDFKTKMPYHTGGLFYTKEQLEKIEKSYPPIGKIEEDFNIDRLKKAVNNLKEKNHPQLKFYKKQIKFWTDEKNRFLNKTHRSPQRYKCQVDTFNLCCQLCEET